MNQSQPENRLRCTKCNNPFLDHHWRHYAPRADGVFHTACFEKVNRVEVIDHTRTLEQGGGRVYTFWNGYREEDSKNISVAVDMQDGGKTMKVFIKKITD